MNAMNLAQKAYSSATAPIRTPKGVEYEAFARITSRMSAAAKKGNDGFNDLAVALQQNSRLWTILAVDVVDDRNGLPESLRAQILSLAQFTMTHTGKILQGTESADALIDINTSIMRGLRQQELKK